jgi:phage terminase large subunit
VIPELHVPKKLRPILEKQARYKVAHGGRGSAKSWTFARGLLLKAMESPKRILCAREIQRSIKDSVHRLLSDQIQELGLGGAFQITDTEIRGYNGSLFLFSGLQGHTVESIKSYEGVDIVWIEEAQTISKHSMQILTPTIRKPGSEVWISLNPRVDTDYIWTEYVLHPPENSIVIEINYPDNPYFPEVLEQERQHAEKTMTREDYENIWEGKPRATIEGAIYSSEVDTMIRGKRVRPVPYDPGLKVHTIWDLGFNDATAIILVQAVASEVRIIHYIEDTHKPLDHYAAMLNDMRLNWGKDWLPHDGYAATLAAGGQSVANILKRLGRKVSGQKIPNVPVETGIKIARMLFPRVYVDNEYGARLIECLKRYRRNKPSSTGEEGGPVHDEYSHGADAWRYLALSVSLLTNEDEDGSGDIVRDWVPHERRAYG